MSVITKLVKGLTTNRTMVVRDCQIYELKRNKRKFFERG